MHYTLNIRLMQKFDIAEEQHKREIDTFFFWPKKLTAQKSNLNWRLNPLSLDSSLPYEIFH